MANYQDLNTLQRRRTDMGDNIEEMPIVNPTREVSLAGDTRAIAYFRDLETPLLQHIREADAVVGCVAWLTNLKVLEALATKRAASILVQKEDFLRPDRGPLHLDWKERLRRHYEAIQPIRAPGHLDAGWLEVRSMEIGAGAGEAVYSVGLRCIGHHQSDARTMPRMHHKFIVFLRDRSESDPEVRDGAWPYHPYALWTGSYNITCNGNASLENAIFIQDSVLAGAYCDEWAQLVEVSEPLDWSSKYAAPEIDYNTGAIVS